MSMQQTGLQHRGRVLLVLSLFLGGDVSGQGAPPVASDNNRGAGRGPEAPVFPVNLKPNVVQGVKLSVKDRPLGSVLRDLARQANLKLWYDKQYSVYERRITIDIAAMPVLEAFGIVLSGTGLQSVMASDGETIVVKPLQRSPDSKSVQDSGTITGLVVDSTNRKGIANATVFIEGTRLSVLTNNDGVFTLRGVPVGVRTISVKYVGYKGRSETVEVKGNTTVRVTIAVSASSTTLSEVITTASGKQKRLEVGNDITVINVDSVMRNAPVTSVTDLLETRVPGLIVQRTSGAPGDPSKIRIRGEGSITRSSAPIIVVDGIRINASERFNGDIANADNSGRSQYSAPSLTDQIDPNSIESIEVQKGPAASALYGADAANGAIIITTKKGKTGRSRWSARYSQGVTYLPGEYPLNYFYFGHGPTGWVQSDNNTCVYPCAKPIIDSIVSGSPLNDDRYTVLGRGGDSRMSTSVSGGSNIFGYALTASTGNTTGYVRLPKFEIDRWITFHQKPLPKWATEPDSYLDWALTSNFTVNPSPTVYLASNTSISKSRQTRSPLGRDAIEQLRNQYVDTARLYGTGLFYPSPYERVASITTTVRTTGNTNWQALEWLPLTATVGLDLTNREDRQIIPRGFAEGSVDSLGRFASGMGTDLTQSLSVGLGQGGIQIPFFRTRTLRLLSGVMVTRTSTAIQNVRADTMPLNGYVPERITAGNMWSDSRVVAGWYVEPKFDIKSRFFIVPGLRFDGSNTSGYEAGLSSFPRLSFSWIASDESFFPFKQIIDLFRVRAALGYAGRLPQSGEHLRLIDKQLQDIDGNLQELLYFKSLGNTRLRPERNQETELGFDAELWKNRLSMNITYSFGKTYEAIVPLPVAPSVFGRGITHPYNIGDVQKQNIELSVNAQLLDQKQVGWNLGATFTRGTNEITSLGGDDVLTRFGQYTYVKGYPVNSIWYKPVQHYADLNDNGIVDGGEIRIADSAVYVGAPYPKFETIVNSSMTIFNGRVSVSGTLRYTNGMVKSFDKRLSGCAYCRPDHPAALSLSEQALQRVGTRFYQAVDVLTLNTFSVNYIVPAGVLRRLGIGQSSIAVQGANLFKQSNYRGKDPDVGKDGLDAGELPLPRQWKLLFQIGN